MLEARTFVSEIESARKILDEQAVFKGEYVCRDAIYSPLDSDKGLADEFLRLRVNEKNIWNEKDVIVAIKHTEGRAVGKNSIIPLRKEFDTEEDAKKYIEENLLDRFTYDFQFTRTGLQYDLRENQIDLEKVEELPGCYTIEVKSPTEEGLRELVEMFHLAPTIVGPSVVEVRKLLMK
jgi:hypothetical protein